MAETTTVQSATGDEFDVEVGQDGKSPVSPNNPPEKSQPEAAPGVSIVPPARSASKAEWKAYVMAHQGYSEEEADDATRNELADEYAE